MFLHQNTDLFASLELPVIKLSSRPPDDPPPEDDDPFGDFGPEIRIEIDRKVDRYNSFSTWMVFSVKEAEDLVRLLSQLITDARLGIFTAALGEPNSE